MADGPLEKIRGWAGADPRVTVEEDGTLLLSGDPPLTVSVSADDERVVLTHAHEAPGAGAALADTAVRALGGRRGTLVEGSAKVTTAGVTVTLESPIYLDGLSRDSFARALQDLAAEADAVLAAVGATPGTTTQPEPEGGGATADADAETREVERTASWAPTHQVPSGGMQAWARPDPSLEASAQLEARVQLAIAERRGDWARVIGSNGWTGWVDARRLEAVAGAPSGSPAAGTIDVAGLRLRPLPLIGALALILGTFVPWFDTGFGTQNGFDVPLAFLWDFTADSSAPYIGWITLALAAGGLAVAAVPDLGPSLSRLLGALALIVAVVFVIQVIRGVVDLDLEVADAFGDFLGFAPYIVAGGGVLMVAGSK